MEIHSSFAEESEQILFYIKVKYNIKMYLIKSNFYWLTRYKMHNYNCKQSTI